MTDQFLIFGGFVMDLFIGALASKMLVEVMEVWYFSKYTHQTMAALKNYYYCNRTSIVICLICFPALRYCRLVTDAVFVMSIFGGLTVNAFKACLNQKHSIVEIHHTIEMNKGNIGRSSAIVYVLNYLEPLHQDLTERISTFEQQRKRQHMSIQKDAVPSSTGLNFLKEYFSKKLYIFIPKSGKNGHRTLADADTNVQVLGNLPTVENDKCGHKKRPYDNTVYHVEGRRMVTDIKNYCFVGEFATPLSAIAFIQNLNRENSSILPDQVELFYLNLVEEIKKMKVKFGDMFCPIYYDDSRTHAISDEVYKRITDEVYELKFS